MRILSVAFLSEGILLVIALLILWAADLRVSWNFTWYAVAFGAIATLPPLAANALLWRYAESNPSTIYARFSREVVVPLCRSVSPVTALILAILAGVCEEMFFRGALNQLIITLAGPLSACIATSLLFAAMHFIGHFKRYGGMIPLYSAMGVYLWLAHYYTNSLAGVALLHGVYNFIVMTTVRIKKTPKRANIN